MAKEDSNVQDIRSEKEDFYSDDSIFNISSWGADLSFRELIARYDENALVKPEIQRNYVWDRSEASRFIDSILLGLPIPSIFLAKTGDEKMLIIDGYQRIMTVHDFVKGVFSADKKVFRLTKSAKVNPRWSGKAFSELTEPEQRRVTNTTIHAIVFVQNAPLNDDTSMYQIFERINTSGRTLLPQEIRNCIYQGSFNRMLIELNHDPTWRRMYGLDNPDPRMRDIEFVLRFLAMDDRDFRLEENESISLKKFLNLFMDEYQTAKPEVLGPLGAKFLETLLLVFKLFGDEAFHNLSPKYPDRLVPKFNPTIFDSIMLASSIAMRGRIPLPDHEFRVRRRQLLANLDYQNSVKIRTTNTAQIVKRISLALHYLYNFDYAQQQG